MRSFSNGSGRVGATLLSALAVFSAASAGAQESVEFSDLAELAATVTAIDQTERLVTLQGPRGNELTVQAGPEVRNLAQLEVGDVVHLSYELYYSAVRIDPEQVPEAVAAAAAGAARAAEGERPGGVVGVVESMIVAIESIGPNGRSATFITPEGSLQAIFVEREEARAFARSLEAGDLVQLTVAEAVAVIVEPLGE
jgi:hypothetical protein